MLFRLMMGRIGSRSVKFGGLATTTCGENDDLVVATHGRSFWILDDITPLRQINGNRPRWTRSLSAHDASSLHYPTTSISASLLAKTRRRRDHHYFLKLRRKMKSLSMCSIRRGNLSSPFEQGKERNEPASGMAEPGRNTRTIPRRKE